MHGFYDREANAFAPIIHRDIKPTNIRIRTQHGQTKVFLVDFGLAKQPSLDHQRTYISLPSAGTPAYAPPEQYADDNRSADARSDVYALGATFYHLLAGYSNEPLSAKSRKPHNLGIGKRPQNVSRQTWRVIQKATELEPEQRYKTVQDMYDALNSEKKSPWSRISAVGGVCIAILIAFNNLVDYIEEPRKLRDHVATMVSGRSSVSTPALIVTTPPVTPLIAAIAHTQTPTVAPTKPLPTDIPPPTVTPSPTSTPMPIVTPTMTPVPPTSPPTATPTESVPTATQTSLPTSTPMPTATSTNTLVPTSTPVTPTPRLSYNPTLDYNITNLVDLAPNELMRLGRGDINGVAYAPDGRTFAVAGQMGVWLYNADLQDYGRLLPHPWPASSVAYSPDGQRIVSSSEEDRMVRIWDITTGTQLVHHPC